MGLRPTIVPALPQGLRSWEEFGAGGQLGLVEELALGYDGPCLDRGPCPVQSAPLTLSQGVLSTTRRCP